ncbi:hypothetical protein ACEN2J_13180 [Pseudorhodobacter sp. W20_MBD10_FR17]|uniref:hypothetical protein n=1 Tax=Pseudorhodobacter sp. W20_MBD10_FR17 TaxID=3240266 RepID=UPI003F9926DF
MFKNWQREKATTALIDEAQALADKLASAKPHVRDGHAAFAQFWQVSYLQTDQDLDALTLLRPEAIARFVAATETKIAALRKLREYESSDGLSIWLHTARAVTEPRIAPAVRQIWQSLMDAGPNADAMTDDLLQDAGLPPRGGFCVPQGFQTEA